jgi:hypothetical protein
MLEVMEGAVPEMLPEVASNVTQAGTVSLLYDEFAKVMVVPPETEQEMFRASLKEAPATTVTI